MLIMVSLGRLSGPHGPSCRRTPKCLPRSDASVGEPSLGIGKKGSGEIITLKDDQGATGAVATVLSLH